MFDKKSCGRILWTQILYLKKEKKNLRLGWWGESVDKLDLGNIMIFMGTKNSMPKPKLVFDYYLLIIILFKIEKKYNKR